MKKLIVPAVYLIICFLVQSCSKGSSTPSKSGSPVDTGAQVTTIASITNPISGVTMDPSGNLYVTDFFAGQIDKITTAGAVTMYAGNGTQGFANGPAASAEFNTPRGTAFDAQGDLYVADGFNNIIRKIAANGTVTTYAGTGAQGYEDGPAAMAEFNTPGGVVVDADGNVYVADLINNDIRKITTAGIVSTLAGNGTQGEVDGPGTSAEFNTPAGICIDASGNLYVEDYTTIRKVTPSGGVTTIAGSTTSGYADGQGSSAEFANPIGIAIDANGTLFIADGSNLRIRKISATGLVTTVAGNGKGGSMDGSAAVAEFDFPTGLVLDASGNIYVGESDGNLRKITF